MYAYDNYGNITSKTQYAYTTTIATDDLTSPIDTISYAYGDAYWKDKLTAYDGVAIDYYAGGNPENYRGWEFEWEKGRQLKSAVGNGHNISFTYNASGIRTSKTVDGVTHNYVLDGAKILRETYGTTKLDCLYDNEDSICGLKYNGTPYYFYKNLQGDVIAIKDADGDIVARYTYDAWGKPLTIKNGSGNDVSGDTSHIANINPFRYRGYYYDKETGFYYLQSRYYDPVVARFINADDAGMVMLAQAELLGANLFAYCNNNPVNRVDHSGKFYWWIIIGALAIIAAILIGKTIWDAVKAVRKVKAVIDKVYTAYKVYKIIQGAFNDLYKNAANVLEVAKFKKPKLLKFTVSKRMSSEQKTKDYIRKCKEFYELALIVIDMGKKQLGVKASDYKGKVWSDLTKKQQDVFYNTINGLDQNLRAEVASKTGEALLPYAVNIIYG